MKRFTFSENYEKTRLMGIINISPDSFYEQSRCNSTDKVLAKAEKMTREGADFLDLGAERVLVPVLSLFPNRRK